MPVNGPLSQIVPGDASSSRFATAGGFGLIDRAEPACALADLHLDLRIPSAGRLMVDAFAGAIDIALDVAFRRRGDRSRGRRQKDGVGVLGQPGTPENGALLVAHVPVPGRDEGTLPQAGLGLARGFLVPVII